jgi:hypothetical protein
MNEGRAEGWAVEMPTRQEGGLAPVEWIELRVRDVNRAEQKSGRRGNQAAD